MNRRHTFRLSHWAVVVGLSMMGWAAQGQIIRGGYEWINPSQAYVRLATWQDAMTRVSAGLVIAADNSFSNVPIGQVKLLYRGQQVPIYISPGSDPTRLDANDVIEFMGYRLDGWQDSIMYRSPFTGAHDPNGIPNRRRSIVNDTAAFFLTYDATPSLRFAPVETATVGGVAEPHFRHESILDFMDDYNVGGASAFDYVYTLNSEYTQGEGWTSGVFGSGSTFARDLPTPHRAPSGPTSPQLRARLIGLNDASHVSRIEVGASAQSYSHSSVNVATYTLNLQPTDLGATTTQVRVLPQGPGLDQQRACWLAMTYDRQFRFDGENQFVLNRWTNPTGSARTLRLEGLNFASASDSGYVFDLTNRRRVRGIVRLNTSTPTRDTLHVTMPGALGDHRLVAVAASGFVNLTTVQVRAAGIRGSWQANQGAELIIITADDYPTAQFRSLSQAYAAYRDTSSANRLSTRVVNIAQLMDEYGYGSNSPVVIKKFIRSAWENWTVKPRYVFIMFKSFGYRIFGVRAEINLPGTWGYPVSDWQLVSNFDQSGRDNTPIVGIGRFNATEPFHLQDYLAKVRDAESRPFEDWMKQVIHLGGGTTLAEQQSIRAALEGRAEPLAEAAPLAASVFYHQKSSSGVVNDPVGQQVSTLINNGVSLITFFGHSTSNQFDIELLDAFNYTNFGRYPLIYANGCYGGDFANSGPSYGERWLLLPGRGALNYLAMSGAGSVTRLGALIDTTYRTLLRDSIGQRLGDGLRWAMGRFARRFSTDLSSINHAMQTNLQGDPTIRLNFPRQADLAVTPGDIRLSPSNATALADSFEVVVSVRNRGLVSPDSFTVTLRHTVLATGRVVDLPPRRMRISLSQDSVRFRIRRDGANLGGLNRFEVSVDPSDQVPEFDATNNQASSELDLTSDLPALLSPWPFAQINRDTVSLVAGRLSVSPPGPVAYFFEIDTVATFDSPLPDGQKRSPLVNGTAVAARWRVPFTLQNGQVYYWRARLATAVNRWESGSFRYIPGPAVGWQQSRAPQYGRNNLAGLQANPAGQRLEFSTVQVRLSISQTGLFSKGIFLGGSRISEQGFSESGTSGTWMVTLDGRNGRVKTPFSALFGNVELHFPDPGFPTMSASIAAAATGDWVLLYCPRGTSGVDLADPSFDALTTMLAQIGATASIRTQPIGTPWLIVGRKGAAVGTATEQYGFGSPFTFEQFLPFAGPTGTMTPAAIGPVTAWGELAYTTAPRELPDYDQVRLRLYGIRTDGSDSLAVDGPAQGVTSLSSLNAARFPRARLELVMTDDTNRTPPQIPAWWVTYTPAPDLAWDPNLNYVFESAQLQEGVPGRLQLTARNLSETAVDSTWAELNVLRADGARVLLRRLRVPPLGANGSAVVNFDVPTVGLDGPALLTAALNPPPGPLEQVLFNNSYSQAFEIRGDTRHPLLDVTFDGRFISAGDVVAPQPEVVIELRDDNPIRAIADTNSLRVRLKNLQTSQDFEPARDLFYSTQSGVPNPELQFTPASGAGGNNRARVVYRPTRFDDGEYLLEVQGTDAAGNRAGLEPYRIRFKVVNASTITHVLNYPNPFSTSTRFVYTLTGSAIPEVFQVHIYTVTGRLVRVIDLKAAGDVRIGTNLSVAAWDGTDEFGDRLANGVYLYKVVLEMPGEADQPQLDDTHTGQYFKGGWGKMVLIR